MIISPQSDFQEKYLNSDANILVVGGAAGSSKSYVGLMRHLRWTEDPKYRGFCVRKNSTTIMKSGGLFDQASQLYKDAYGAKSVKVKLKDQKLVFPSGAEISFTHYENDKAKDSWQGIQSSNTFYDEGTHAEEHHIWWLISRLRSEAKLNPGIWISCNPDPDSYLRDWVDWWLYPDSHPEFGLPDPEKNGATRYVLRLGGELIWADTREELLERYRNPSLPDDHPEQIMPRSFQCLFGTIRDNPTLMKNQPEYLASLESLPDIERQRLLLGNWEAREQSSTYFQREWVEEISHIEDKVIERVRSFDFAGTLKSDSNPSPDYTVSVRMAKTVSGKYIVEDVRRARIRFGDWDKFILECAESDPSGVTYTIPEDPGVAAKRATSDLIRRLAEAGLYAKKLTTNKSKLDRFRPFSSMAQNGGVQFVKGCGTDYENKVFNDLKFVYKEMEAFTGERKRGESGHDDIPDAMSDAFYMLARGTAIPSISAGLNGFNSALKSPVSF